MVEASGRRAGRDACGDDGVDDAAAAAAQQHQQPLLVNESATDGAGLPLARVVWRSGLWRILAVLLVYSLGERRRVWIGGRGHKGHRDWRRSDWRRPPQQSPTHTNKTNKTIQRTTKGFSTLLPVTPTLFTDFFARRRAGGVVVSCQDTPRLPACVDAHADVVRWSSATAFVSSSVVAFLFSPLVGDASDAYGRRPFLAAGFALALLPAAVVAGGLALPEPGSLLLWYYPASVLSGAVPSLVVCLSYTADVLPPAHRTVRFVFFSRGGIALPPCFSHTHTHALTHNCNTIATHS